MRRVGTMGYYWQFLIGLWLVKTGSAQTTPASSPLPTKYLSQVEYKVYTFNNAFKYDSSMVLLRRIIDSPTTTSHDRFYAFLYLSFTYKRLFDYKSTLKLLDSALVYGQQTPHRAYFEANIACQKAYVLFDTQRYQEADQKMQQLARTKYQHLDEEQKAKIIMQEAYLLYLSEQYSSAETRYGLALSYLSRSSPCDVPMIYTKLIQLYGKMGNEAGMQWAAKRSMAAADSCKITKYGLYTYDELYRTYEVRGNINAAYAARKTYDSLSNIYKQEEHLLELKEKELKYQQEKSKISTQLYQERLNNERQKNYILVGTLVAFASLVTSYLLWQRQRQLKREKEINLGYTKQLLQNMEEERKRIAHDLHDSINYELLSLKKSVHLPQAEEKIDQIINDIRIISRNLRPALFDKIGLVPNLEQLIERLQEQHNLLISTEIDYGSFLKTDEELQLYRIVQEALTNVVKYAKAYAAKITLHETPEKVRLVVEDNGIGFDVAKTLTSTTSFGLHNIMERSRIIGGTTKIQSSTQGTVIAIEIKK